MISCTGVLPKQSLNYQQIKKYLGATPGIIQVLHTWNQELEYHVHMHCIVSGGGITQDFKLRRSKGKFFIPVHVLRDKFKGKFPYDIVNITLHFFLKDIWIYAASCNEA